MKFYNFVISCSGCSGVGLSLDLAKSKIILSILLIAKNIHTFKCNKRYYWDTFTTPVISKKISTWNNLSFFSNDYKNDKENKPSKYYGIKRTNFLTVYNSELIIFLFKDKKVWFNLILTGNIFLKAALNFFLPKENNDITYFPIYQSIR